MSIILTIVGRDLKVAFQRWDALVNPLIFFVVVASLFPLALSPEKSELLGVGTAVLWVAALLSTLLALDGLFQSDADDGSLEQLALSPAPLGLAVLAKSAAHWLISGVPLIITAPLLAYAFYLPVSAIPTLLLALGLATPALSMLGTIGAAVTVNLKRGGSLLGLLVLPLMIPVLIFGTRATELAIRGEAATGPLYLLAAFAVLAISLGPPTAAAALRASLE